MITKLWPLYFPAATWSTPSSTSRSASSSFLWIVRWSGKVLLWSSPAIPLSLGLPRRGLPRRGHARWCSQLPPPIISEKFLRSSRDLSSLWHSPPSPSSSLRHHDSRYIWSSCVLRSTTSIVPTLQVGGITFSMSGPTVGTV